MRQNDKQRDCYGCGVRLSFASFMGMNWNGSLEHDKNLKKIWESSHVELYCCDCYNVELYFEGRITKVKI